MSEESPYHHGAAAKDEDNRKELALDRTEMAEDRTVMAVERTFAGWIRTAFGAIGIGLGFRALFGELDPPWLARAIATGFFILAAALSFTSERRASRSLKRMAVHAITPLRTPNLRWIAWSVGAGAVVLAVAIWLSEKVVGG